MCSWPPLRAPLLICANACMPFYLTPTFSTKTFLDTINEIFFVFFFLCIFFFREEPHFSCKLLTWNPGTMRMWLKRIVFPSLSSFSISNTSAYNRNFLKFWWFLIISNGGGVLESKWIMMTAMIQTDYVIFSTVCLGLVRKGITSVKQLWIRVLNI